MDMVCKMAKSFNVTGKCYPEKHYMVSMDKTLRNIEDMVDAGAYFCINRGRQYGKTTAFSLLKERLSPKYNVFSISFEGLADSDLESLESLSRFFFAELYDYAVYDKKNSDNKVLIQFLTEKSEEQFVGKRGISRSITQLVEILEKPVILLVDEVDQASNYSSFLQFLGVLRDKYLKKTEIPTFHSVILASVYDIKNLKLKLRPEEEHKYNSPWNIAAEFTCDMSFSALDICEMLTEYEAEHSSGMTIDAVAKEIRDYTAGYPYLVSRLCMLIDKKQLSWNHSGINTAVKMLLSENNTLFDDISKKLNDYPEMKQMCKAILYEGRQVAYTSYNTSVNIAELFGYIKNDNGFVAIANRVFEMFLYNLFASEEYISNKIYGAGSREKKEFVKGGKLDMRHVLERFVVHYTDIYGNREESFHEAEGRKQFMLYMKPIINGTGNMYTEAQTRDENRTDLIIDYLGEQHIVEMKIWRGGKYHQDGEKQLLGYLDEYHLNIGYMLTFSFNKNKTIGVKESVYGEKTIIEAMV